MFDIDKAILRIASFRKDILAKRSLLPLYRKSLSDVRRVVIINSASRSGSSLLYALLSKLPQVYSLTGEAAPFYKLNTNLRRFNPHCSDTLPSERLDELVDFESLSRDFLSDLSLSEQQTDPRRIDVDSYVDDLMLRTVLQWPTIDFPSDQLKNCITQAFVCHTKGVRRFDTTEFYLELLTVLNSQWPEINPFYYDIGTDRVALRFPYLDIPNGPPNSEFTMEEPPFVLLPPGIKPTVADLSGKTLLLKSTVDCYRMNLIERIFPNGADIRIIHLVRNPAATINGLYDGWLHRGFYSHNLATCFNGCESAELHIKGYSENSPFGRYWWNFDLPVGWQGVVHSELVDVCAFQWYSANTEILKHVERTHRQVCTIHFEDIIRTAASRQQQFERLLDFMDVPCCQMATLGLDALPVVQATLPPQLYRWKRRADMIEKVLDAPNISEMAARFGYVSENRESWL